MRRYLAVGSALLTGTVAVFSKYSPDDPVFVYAVWTIVAASWAFWIARYPPFVKWLRTIQSKPSTAVPPESRLAEPFLIPVFDYPWGRHWNDPIPQLIVRNTSDVDAFRVSIAPIDLGHGIVLATGNTKTDIPSRQEKAIPIGRQVFDRSALSALPPQPIDLVKVVQDASTVKSLGSGFPMSGINSWPVLVDYSAADGQPFKAQWELQNDIKLQRVRIVSTLSKFSDGPRKE